jgi:hypothetical protein
MARMPDNIEWLQYPGKPRKYVGYANGVWSIRRDTTSRSWYASRMGHVIQARTLAELGRKLEAFNPNPLSRD